MLEYSIQAFEECRDITGYVVVTRESDVRRMERIARRVRAARLIAVVIGGRHRADSVRNGLDRLPEQGWVAVHDAARPMVTPGMLSAGASLARRGLAAVFARPVNDTLKRGTPKRLHATVSREGLYAAQTPQFFPIPMLRRAHRHAGRTQAGATDDCELVERLGVRPVLLPGPAENIKVTTPGDLRIVKALL